MAYKDVVREDQTDPLGGGDLGDATESTSTSLEGLGGGDSTGPIEPLPGDTPPEPARPPMPPAAGGTSATPLGAGTFQLPGQGGGAAAAFRTPGFLQNRFVGGRGVGPQDERIGSPGGEAAQITGGLGAQPTPTEVDPEQIRQMFLGILGRRQ